MISSPLRPLIAFFFMVSGGLAVDVPVTFLELQKMVDLAKTEGRKALILHRGRLHIDTETVVVSNVDGFALEGTGPGVTLVGHTLRPVLTLKNCRRVRLSRFAVDYDPLPFTQVRVTRVSEDRLDYQVLPAYPELDKAYLSTTALHFQGKENEWCPEGRELYFRENQAVSADKGFLAGCRMPADTGSVRVGDRLVLVARHAPAILLSDCSDVTFEDITVNAAPSAGILFRYLSGTNRFKNVRIDRGPRLQPAMEDRLLSTGSTGFVIGFSKGVSRFEDYSAAWCGGDGIHTLGMAFPVLAGEGWVYRVGDRFGDLEHLDATSRRPVTFRGIGSGNWAVKGTAPVTAMVHDRIPGQVSTARLVFDGLMQERLKVGDVVDIPEWNGGRITVDGGRFRNLRGAGIRHGSESLTVTRSFFEGITLGAIVAPAAYDRFESGYTGALSISGCAFIAREMPGGTAHPLEGAQVRFLGPAGWEKNSHGRFDFGGNIFSPPDLLWVENPPVTP